MIINLAGVTKTLQRLISLGVYELAEVTVTTHASPPDAAAPGEISVHLFHGIESPEYKNYTKPGISGKGSVQFVPMGMILQYVISMPVRGTGGEESSSYTEYDGQRFLGYIARVLHDYPVVDEELELLDGDQQQLVHVLDPDLFGASIEFHLRPVKIEENISFWSAEQTFAPRFSLFVEARVAVLEPRQPKTIPGRVFSLGGGVTASLGPELLAGKSVQTFRVPAVTGLEVQTVALSPPRPVLLVADLGAGPSYLPAGVPPFAQENNRVRVVANGLAPQRSLVIKGESLDVEVPLDAPLVENAPWDFIVTGRELSFRVWTRIRGSQRGSATREWFEITPGSYSLRVLQRDVSLGGVTLGSTPLLLLIVPQTLGVTKLGGEYVLRVAGNYLEELSAHVGLVVGGTNYEISSEGSLTAEHFEIDPTEEDSNESSLRFVIPDAVIPSPSHPLSVQLLVRGTSATPQWVEE